MPLMSFLEAVSKPREIVRPIGLNGKTETQFVDNISRVLSLMSSTCRAA